MDAVTRRKKILENLIEIKEPVKGQNLASKFNVTRQVIVKDMAILKAAEEKIVSTSGGYLYIGDSSKVFKRVLSVKHEYEKINKELSIILKYGGVIEDIMIEHPFYGELKASLYLRNFNDLDEFLKKFQESGAIPLSNLTNGVHYHTVSCSSEEELDRIEEELLKEAILI